MLVQQCWYRPDLIIPAENLPLLVSYLSNRKLAVGIYSHGGSTPMVLYTNSKCQNFI